MATGAGVMQAAEHSPGAYGAMCVRPAKQQQCANSIAVGLLGYAPRWTKQTQPLPALWFVCISC